MSEDGAKMAATSKRRRMGKQSKVERRMNVTMKGKEGAEERREGEKVKIRGTPPKNHGNRVHTQEK